jgi:beta-glucosidase
VTLKPGETRRITLVAEPRLLADYDTTLPGWRIQGGAYRVAVAHDATDRAMVSTTRIDAQTMKP